MIGTVITCQKIPCSMHDQYLGTAQYADAILLKLLRC